MDEVGRVERNNSAVRKGFYTVSEAATTLGVGQRRILEMLGTKEIEGKQDPISGRWKIPTHAVHELAPEETPDTKEPTLASQPPREDPTERSSEQSAEEIRERIDELERLNERLQLEQQADKTAWQKERGSLLAAANRELQRTEELQKEVARLSTELEANWELTSKLERLNERLQVEQQAEKTAWQEEKESLLAAADRERQHAEELQEEVERLSTELEAERRKRSWRRLFRK